MTIEKTFKLTIKDTTFINLTEEEVTALYEQCRQALNISVTNPSLPSFPPGVRKFDPIVPTDKTTPTYPNWPSYPLPNTYCGNVPFGTTTTGTTTTGTTTTGTTTTGTTDNSVMDWHNYHVTGTSISTANVPSSNGINFISDDMETIKDNNKWRSSVQQALDKLNAKTNITTKLNSKTNITTNDGTTIR